MSRRDSFEAYWSAQHDVPVESLAQYRCDDDRQYRLPKMAGRFRVWCAALDSVVVELPEPMKAPDRAWNESTRRAENGKFVGFNRALRMAKRAIKAAGVRVAE